MARCSVCNGVLPYAGAPCRCASAPLVAWRAWRGVIIAGVAFASVCFGLGLVAPHGGTFFVSGFTVLASGQALVSRLPYAPAWCQKAYPRLLAMGAFCLLLRLALTLHGVALLSP